MAGDDRKKYVFTQEEIERGAVNDDDAQNDGAPKQSTTSTPAVKKSVASVPAAATKAGRVSSTQENEPPVEPLDMDGLTKDDLPQPVWTEPEMPKAAPSVEMPDLKDVVQRNQWIEAHPWVTGTDYKNTYRVYNDLTPAQLLRDIAEYRRMEGKEIEAWEWPAILAGRDPNQSEREARREERREAWANRINAIGDVVNHFVNFGRAMGGNPIAQVRDTYNPEQAARLRAAHENLRRQHYLDYMNAMKWKYDQTKREREAAAKIKARQEAEKIKWESPLYQEQLKGQQLTNDIKKEELETKRWTRINLSNEESRKDAESKGRQAVLAARASAYEARAKNNCNNKTGNKNNGNNKPYYVIGPNGEKRYFDSRNAALVFALDMKKENYDRNQEYDLKREGVHLTGDEDGQE